MPFYLKELDVTPRVAGLRSVLIVPCRFCPAASLAVKTNEPYLEPLRRLLRTEAYEVFIRALRRRLEEQGIRTALFDAKLLHQFLPCMWPRGRRRALARRAREFEGVVVLGCEAAAEMVRDAIGSARCRVVAGMEAEGVMSVVPTVTFPLKISLAVQGITPVRTTTREAERAGGARDRREHAEAGDVRVTAQ